MLTYTPNLLIYTLVGFLVLVTAFNVSWWLAGKTLSETYPAVLVLPVMLVNIFCFYMAFKLLLDEACGKFVPSDWGYTTELGAFVPYARDIARILSGLLSIGVAILMYRDEGKISDSKVEINEDDYR